jgi:hypothetical protein
MKTPLSRAEDYLTQAGLLNEPGKVLYSSEVTLRSGPVYLLGLNPGGFEGATLGESVVQSRTGHNAYLDEQWSRKKRLQPIGDALLQRRIRHLCEVMNLDPRAVPASNLVFTRSSRINTHADFPTAVAMCTPVHVIFMEAIKPSFLMTFGSLANFRKAVTIIRCESRSAGHAAWKAHRGRLIFAGREVEFGNVPHMSLWASDKHLDVLRWTVAAMFDQDEQ